MADTLQQTDPLDPDISHLVTEDDTPVDNRFSERQQKLLSLVLFDSWEEGKPFEALTNVGLFSTPSNEKVVVPDFLLSLDVEPRELSGEKKDQSYFTWVYGKAPDLVVEIVSNKEGGELKRKLEIYQRIGVPYYAILDPFRYLGQRLLRLYQLVAGRYVEVANPSFMPEIGLGFTFWEGVFLDVQARWLRFTGSDGQLLLTGKEREELALTQACESEQRARESEQKARESEQRASESEQRAKALEQKLRELGHDPI